MKATIFLVTVLIFSMFACKSSKTIVPENKDTLCAIVGFTIEKDGSMSNVKIVSSSGDTLLDAEALRVVKSSPPWEPAIQRGKPVRVKYTFPVRFTLTDTETEKG